MARLDEIVPGTDYFLVHYYDRNLLVPSIQTLRYEGRTIATEERTTLWVFREPRTEPPLTADNIPTLEEQVDATEPPLIGLSESQLTELLDFDGLLAVLAELKAVRSPAVRSVDTGITPEQLLERHPLRDKITEFLASPASTSLHIQVRYTDDGFFLVKEPAGLEIRLYNHPLRAPARDASLLAIMHGAGLTAHTNYLSDRGRTRILAYHVPADPAALAILSARILAIGYEMRTTDELHFPC